MTNISVGSYNIEKNGQSSDPEKQTKVSDFIAQCCDYNIDIIFLCEVHSARWKDYISTLRGTYGADYDCRHLGGGYSNSYVVLVRNLAGLDLDFYPLQGLNRSLLIARKGAAFAITLAHFKSGQTNLTKSQLEAAADFLEDFSEKKGKWAITGDMNWDWNNFKDLELPANAHSATCWA